MPPHRSEVDFVGRSGSIISIVQTRRSLSWIFGVVGWNISTVLANDLEGKLNESPVAEIGRNLLTVTVDIVGFPPPVNLALVDRLAADGWTRKQVMLLPSHSHTRIEMSAINPADTFDVPQIGIYILSAAEYRRGRCESSVRFYGESLGETIVSAPWPASSDWRDGREV
jgi:hypothetical protein